MDSLSLIISVSQSGESGCYQDIIFYSENDLPDIRFDGVFYVRKVDADTRIKELIELKLWRLSDPASVRGWIVADAIEIEGMLTELLEQCFTPRDGFTFTHRFLYSHNSPIDFGRKYDIYHGILGDFIEWLGKQEVKDILKINQLKDCELIYKEMKKEIVQIRNSVAHHEVNDSEAGKFIGQKTSSALPIKLDDATFIKVRKDLRKHRDNLLKLHSLITLI